MSSPSTHSDGQSMDATSITTGTLFSLTPPPDDEYVKDWLQQAGFSPGDFRTEKLFDTWNSMCPMVYAASESKFDICIWLYNHGARDDISKSYRNGCTPMYYAYKHGHLEFCKWLYMNGLSDINRPFENGDTTMIVAIQFGHLEICKWLLEVGSSNLISIPDNYGNTPMYIACEVSQLKICHWLFSKGAVKDVSTKNDHGNTPLHQLCIEYMGPKGDSKNKVLISIANWLYEHGADKDISVEDDYGDTPMHLACQGGVICMAQWLLEKGAESDLQKRNKDYMTPFECMWYRIGNQFLESRKHYYISVVKWLVLKGGIYKIPSFDPNMHSDELNKFKDIILEFLFKYLYPWAQEKINLYHLYVNVFLRGSVLIPSASLQNPGNRCPLPRLPVFILKHIGVFLDVSIGKEYQNVINFLEEVKKFPSEFLCQFYSLN